MPRKRTSSEPSSTKKKTRVESLTSIDDQLAHKCIQNIRVLSADIVEKANSGHPGAPLGCAPMAHLLWGEFMNFNPVVPTWINRDRFVLSNGHACALLYRFLSHLFFYSFYSYSYYSSYFYYYYYF